MFFINLRNESAQGAEQKKDQKIWNHFSTFSFTQVNINRVQLKRLSAYSVAKEYDLTNLAKFLGERSIKVYEELWLFTQVLSDANV